MNSRSSSDLSSGDDDDGDDRIKLESKFNSYKSYSDRDTSSLGSSNSLIQQQQRATTNTNTNTNTTTTTTAATAAATSLEASHEGSSQAFPNKYESILISESKADFWNRGVSITFLEQLFRKRGFENSTAREVVAQYVIPQTSDLQCSVVSLLRQIRPADTGTATHFVSYSWDNNFGRLVRALSVIAASYTEGTPYFWLDLFAIPQHIHSERYFQENERAWMYKDDMFARVRKTIENVKSTVVFLDPAQEPLAPKRSWCLFEICLTLVTNGEVTYALCPEPPGTDIFEGVIKNVDQAIENYNVNFADSKTSIEKDKIWLQHEVVRSHPLGLIWLNQHVGESLQGWMAERLLDIVLEEHGGFNEDGEEVFMNGDTQEVDENAGDDEFSQLEESSPIGGEGKEKKSENLDGLLLEGVQNVEDGGNDEESDDEGDTIVDDDEFAEDIPMSQLSLKIQSPKKKSKNSILSNKSKTSGEGNDSSQQQMYGRPLARRRHKSTNSSASSSKPKELNLASTMPETEQEQEEEDLVSPKSASVASGTEISLEVQALAMRSLAKLFEKLKRYDESRFVFEKALSLVSENDFMNVSEASILSISNDYACLLAKEFHEIEEAEARLRIVLEAREKLLGREATETMETVLALARLLNATGRLDEAETLFRRAMQFQSEVFGSCHRDTLITMNCLALCLQNKGHLEDAEVLFRKSLEGGIETLGSSSLDVMVWANNLAVLLQDMGDHQRAEKLLRMTLRNSEQSLGAAHPQTLVCLYNIGYSLYQQGRLSAAEKFFRRELAGCEAYYGPDHEETIRSATNLHNFLQNNSLLDMEEPEENR